MRTARASGAIVCARAGIGGSGRGAEPLTTRTTRAPWLDLAAAQRLDEGAEGSAARAVGLDPDRLGEQLGVRGDRRFADCEDRAARRPRGAEGEVAVRRVADGE